MIVQRAHYLRILKQWQGMQVIKVVTGIRRCGKSTLLRQFKEQLTQEGVPEACMISINFEDLEFEELLSYKELYRYIKSRLYPEKMNYIFLDEIQHVDQFEKAVDSLHIIPNVDIYMTGSNSYLLSGELATLLSGRYIEISMLPFSFCEYCTAYSNDNTDTLFASYMHDGGFPYLTQFDHSTDQIDTYLEGIYNTIIIKDIEMREQRRSLVQNKRRVSDFSLLRDVARFLASSIGNPISFKSITDYIISSGRRVSQNTISDYVEMLREAFIFYPAERFDISGKQAGYSG